MVWSFSRLNSFYQCPKAWALTYLDKTPRELKLENAFAQWGTYGHKIHELYYTNQLEFFELSEYYSDHYDENVTIPFPPNKYVDLNEKYKEAGQDYFDHFEGLPDNYEVIGVEQEILVKINHYNFTGYIDLILKDKNDGQYIIYDHKSKNKFSSEKEKAEYARQLYLYSIYIYNHFHVYPKLLIFNMFRSQEIVEIPFLLNDFYEAQNWVVDTIEKIKKTTSFIDKITLDRRSKKQEGKEIKKFRKNDFFCNWLCDVAFLCTKSNRYKKGGNKIAD